ncbi:MAG: class I SAM-dependent rRNA methyltransferase [Ignavibacteriae bacterium HGW-Ignavibacteriae-3]|nr:MAG: class I SAM-dependent rRNA methyltransferase [Ignavibacteriae bacterium HGW-Ignavibacteriae-3]
MTKVFLKKNEERRVRLGHLWIFSNEIAKIEGMSSNGDLVKVFDSRENFTGCGFYNANSLIAVRMVSDADEFDIAELFRKRLHSAYDFRKSVYPDRDSFRMVFSESDFLPGLIIDKYNNTFVLQIYSAGIEKNIDTIVKILKEDFSAENIFTKGEEYFRKMEGLPIDNKIYFGEIKDEIITDGRINYKINFSTGQKTGFYFDQSDNRKFFGELCEGKSVLDCFCNSGGFGLHAAYGKSKSVLFVDASSEEIKNAQGNFLMNGFTCVSDFVQFDVFDYLEKCIAENKKFDVINLDPPAFAKNKKTLATAVKGYEKLNRLAMELIEDGGVLLTSSCSHHVNEDMFLESIGKASVKAGKNIQLFYFNNASMDHPSLPAMDETEYLKFAAFKVSNK